MASKKRSWLEGPQLPSEFRGASAQNEYPGQALGLAKQGPGSLASVMRRVGGIFLDWFMALFIAIIIHSFTTSLGGISTIALGVFFIIGVVSVALFARTPGQAMMKMGVARVDRPGTRVGIGRCILRSFLTLLIFPPIVVDEDGRGVHDRVTGTAVILG